MHKKIIGLSLGLVLLIACGEEATQPQQRIEESTVWEEGREVEVEGDLEVNAPLIIKPGVTVRFMNGGRFIVGRNVRKAKLRIEGTSANPVRLVGESRSITWGGVQIFNTSEESCITHCIIEGVSREDEAALWVHNLNFPIEHVQMRNTSGTGMQVQEYTPSGRINSCRVQVRGGHACVVPSSMLHCFTQNQWICESDGYGVMVHGGRWVGTLSLDGTNTTANTSLPDIYVKGELVIDGEVTLRNLHFFCGANSNIEWGCYVPTLLEVKNCSFLSEESPRDGSLEKQGLWGGLKLGGKLQNKSSFIGNKVYHAGHNMDGSVEISAPKVDFRENAIMWSKSYGVVVRGTSSAQAQMNENTFDHNAQGNFHTTRGGV